LLPKGCEERGWSHATGELSKVLGFFEVTTVLSFVVPSPTGKNYGMKVGLGVDMDETSYVAVLRAEARLLASEELLTMHFGESWGKDQLLPGNPLGYNFDTQHGSFERGIVECAAGVVVIGAEFQQ
jgi:hypothetical protein